MKTIKATAAILLILSSLQVHSSTSRICEVTNDYSEKCLTEKDFDEVVDTVIDSFAPEFAKNNWALVANKQWQSEYEGANYGFPSNKVVSLNIHGGAARAAEITKDALALIVCHELGHVYGWINNLGDPKLFGAEGEADYFAASACAPIIFHQNQFNSKVEIPDLVQQKCDQTLDPSTCVRVNKAGLAASRHRARVWGVQEPSFLTPDLNIVPEISHDTNPQCGLDTFYAASLKIQRPSCWFKQE